jgi:hypothetical protein
MPSFYFEQLLQDGLNGIDQQGITASVLEIADVVLILSLLWAVYEAYSNGGDVRSLGVAGVKYLVLGLVFLNYPSAFRAVNSMCNGIADGIYNLSGGFDAVQSWLNSLSQAWNSNPDWFSALWNLVLGGASSMIAGLITLVGYLILPITYTLFALFYALYGAILYVVGPFVLALMPARGLGQMGRLFFTNLMIFQCWGLLYAILQSLMSALEITNPMQFSGSFLHAFVGSSQVIVMSVASVLLSVMIALIPFIASRIVRGDIGATLMTVISGAVTAGAVASGLASAGEEGVAAGRTLAPAGSPPPPLGWPGGANPSQVSVLAGPRGGNGGSAVGESRPPRPLASAIGNDGAGATASAANPKSFRGWRLIVLSDPCRGLLPVCPNGVNIRVAQSHHRSVGAWNRAGWQESGRSATPTSDSSAGEGSVTYGATPGTGGNAGGATRGYAGRSACRSRGLAGWTRGGHNDAIHGNG